MRSSYRVEDILSSETRARSGRPAEASRARRNSREAVGLSFGQVSRGMRVRLHGLEGTESHLNGREVTVIATQPATGFCTVECDDRSSWHVEPLNMAATSGDGSAAEKAPRWKAVEAPDGRTYYHNVETNETSWHRPAELDPVASPPPRQPPGGGLSEAIGGLGVGSTRADEGGSIRGEAAPAPAPVTDWKEVRSSDGRTYYHNQRTNQTSWERPAELDAPAAAPNPSPPPERRRQRRVVSADPEPSESRPSDARAFLSSLEPVVRGRGRGWGSACACRLG